MLGITYDQLFKVLTTVSYSRSTTFDSNIYSGVSSSSSSNGTISSGFGSYNNLVSSSINSTSNNISSYAFLTNDMIQQNIHALMKVLYRNIVYWINERINQAHESLLHDDKQLYLDSRQQQQQQQQQEHQYLSISTTAINYNNNNNNINHSYNNITPGDGMKYIEIIDTIGMEAIEINSLEQLLINYTAELFQFQSFQQYFSKDIIGNNSDMYYISSRNLTLICTQQRLYNQSLSSL